MIQQPWIKYAIFWAGMITIYAAGYYTGMKNTWGLATQIATVLDDQKTAIEIREDQEAARIINDNTMEEIRNEEHHDCADMPLYLQLRPNAEEQSEGH